MTLRLYLMNSILFALNNRENVVALRAYELGLYHGKVH